MDAGNAVRCIKEFAVNAELITAQLLGLLNLFNQSILK